MGTITLTLPVAHTDITAGTLAGDFTTIQTVINGGLDNNNLAPGFKRTTSAYAGGPPGSPTDGDIWVATAVEGSANRWSFQYEAAWVTDAYKWKFIGGSSLFLSQDGSITVAATASPSPGSNGTGTVAAVTYSPTRSGVYQARHTGTLSNTTSVGVTTFISMGGTNYSGNSGIPTAGGFIPALAENEQACTTGSTIVPTYSNNNSGTLTVTVRRLVITPSRII